MATPDFVLELRRHVGHAPLWMPGTTVVILRPAPGCAPIDWERTIAPEAVDILCERIEEGRYGAPAMPKHVTVGYEVLMRESSNRTR